jgi:hypothetical protein
VARRLILSGSKDMKMNAKNFWNIYMLGVMVIVLAMCKYTNVEAAEPVISFSLNADGSQPKTLQGDTLDGMAYLSLPEFKGENLTLRWNANKGGNVDGYIVFQGTTPENVQPFGELVPHNDSDVIAASWPDSEFTLDDTLKACFRLKAYNQTGESGYSDSVCTVINRVESITFYIDGTRAAVTPLDTFTLSDGQHSVEVRVKFKQQDKILKVGGAFTTVKKLTPPGGVVVESELVW